jgi:two-component system cell cycle response regulator DivK
MPAQILIIEDNEMSFVLADYLLRQAGYVNTRAEDGHAAVRLALENVADLILCDLDLPGMDGYEVLQALRADPSWRRVPVLAFTADSKPQLREDALKAGFSGSILKPVDPRTFPADIARYLQAAARAS